MADEVRTYGVGTLCDYKYVVIFARAGDGGIYCRHRERDTWEAPGGHIEPGERPLDAAKRELYEETGAVDFDIEPIFDYSVAGADGVAYGRVFLARIRRLGGLPESSEMAETRVCESYPARLTYPHILPLLFRRAAEYFGRISVGDT